VSIIVLIGLFFVQKYVYLIDRKLNQAGHSNSDWEGKPWPLVAAISLGILTMLYNVFSPEDIKYNPSTWSWPEWLMVISVVLLFITLSFESMSHFGFKYGLLRFLIIGSLMVAFFVAGFFAGLLITAVLAMGGLIYFIRYWRKLMVIK
jgi:hypothetical protein